MQKEQAIGNELYLIGLQLEPIKVRDGLLSKLDELDSCLTNMDQFDWRLLNWALQPIVTLVQDRLMEHPCEDVRLIVAACLGKIIRIATPSTPYNDNILKGVL